MTYLRKRGYGVWYSFFPVGVGRNGNRILIWGLPYGIFGESIPPREFTKCFNAQTVYFGVDGYAWIFIWTGTPGKMWLLLYNFVCKINILPSVPGSERLEFSSRETRRQQSQCHWLYLHEDKSGQGFLTGINVAIQVDPICLLSRYQHDWLRRSEEYLQYSWAIQGFSQYHSTVTNRIVRWLRMHSFETSRIRGSVTEMTFYWA